MAEKAYLVEVPARKLVVPNSDKSHTAQFLRLVADATLDGGITLSEVVGHLWPEADLKQARNRFHVTKHSVDAIYGVSIVRSDDRYLLADQHVLVRSEDTYIFEVKPTSITAHPHSGNIGALLYLLIDSHPKGLTKDEIVESMWPGLSRIEGTMAFHPIKYMIEKMLDTHLYDQGTKRYRLPENLVCHPIEVKFDRKHRLIVS